MYLKYLEWDVPDIRFLFQLAGYLAISYSLVPDLAEMLNVTGYRSRIFYCQYNSITA